MACRSEVLVQMEWNGMKCVFKKLEWNVLFLKVGMECVLMEMDAVLKRWK